MTAPTRTTSHYTDPGRPARQVAPWIHAGLAAVLAVAATVLYYLLAAGFFITDDQPDGSPAETWACVGGMTLTATTLILAYRPIVDGPGRTLAFVASGIAALSPLVGFLVHSWS
ncbi:hypothetical protein [Microbacterium thalli]|uniref:hypothetical protein n=1 Tax=Microbacterium thalli TaxID=3027921 RepID=UPI002364FF44|nr:hypothetical protein [Microbacterium thalli]MDD7928066.1 hypothetical protein [Microbacterium thalli]